MNVSISSAVSLNTKSFFNTCRPSTQVHYSVTIWYSLLGKSHPQSHTQRPPPTAYSTPTRYGGLLCLIQPTNYKKVSHLRFPFIHSFLVTLFILHCWVFAAHCRFSRSEDWQEKFPKDHLLQSRKFIKMPICRYLFHLTVSTSEQHRFRNLCHSIPKKKSTNGVVSKWLYRLAQLMSIWLLKCLCVVVLAHF